MINRLVYGCCAFKAHRIFIPPVAPQLNNNQMVVLACHKPFITIQRGQQVSRRLANLDPVARPNLNCLCLTHSQHSTSKDRLAVQYAFQNCCDGFRPDVNRIDRDEQFLIRLCR
jgi:hypothetical protein